MLLLSLFTMSVPGRAGRPVRPGRGDRPSPGTQGWPGTWGFSANSPNPGQARQLGTPSLSPRQDPSHGPARPPTRPPRHPSSSAESPQGLTSPAAHHRGLIPHLLSPDPPPRGEATASPTAARSWSAPTGTALPCPRPHPRLRPPWLPLTFGADRVVEQAFVLQQLQGQGDIVQLQQDPPRRWQNKAAPTQAPGPHGRPILIHDVQRAPRRPPLAGMQPLRRAPSPPVREGFLVEAAWR